MLPNRVDVIQSKAKKLDILLARSLYCVNLCERLRTVHGSLLLSSGAPSRVSIACTISPHLPCMGASGQQELIQKSIDCHKWKEVKNAPVIPPPVPSESRNLVFLE